MLDVVKGKAVATLAADEGEVLEILVAEGSENVKVNTPIARLAGEAGRHESFHFRLPSSRFG